jgi:hypothetical protein
MLGSKSVVNVEADAAKVRDKFAAERCLIIEAAQDPATAVQNN